MKSNIGIWMDHRGAWIFNFSGLTDSRVYITSKFKRNHHSKGSVFQLGRSCRSYSGSHHNFDRKKHEQLQRFYKTIEGMLQSAQRVAILGPGLAKIEFHTHLSKELKKRVCTLKSADYLSLGQMAHQFKEIFHLRPMNG